MASARGDAPIRVKFKVKKEAQQFNTSDDIWMRFENLDSELMEREEISVSDPEDYLAVKLPEGVMMEGESEGFNIEGADLSHCVVEFPQCYQKGIFCYDYVNEEGATQATIHYHCPSCLRHCENDLQFIQSHYTDCAAASNNASISTLCQHDNYIKFTECRSSDASCPAFDTKAPTHYHCPCCLIFAQQNIFQVIKHQLNCCKSLMDWNPSEIPPDTDSTNDIDNPCTHKEGDVKFFICYKSDPGCCVDGKKECHFHCPCCEEYSESRIRLLKKHQRNCCKSINKVDRMNYVLNVATAIERVYISGNVLNRKRKPSKVAQGSSKTRKLSSQDEEDHKLFPKCFDETCCVREKNRMSHLHCPSCETYTARRVNRLKSHYEKCTKKNPEIRAGIGELQCEVVDKTNGIFLVRAALTGPGTPAHVIYRPPHHFYCDDGCKNDDSQYFCKHLYTCERFVKNGYLDEVSFEVQDSSCLGNLLHLDETSKTRIYVLFQQCLEIGVPAIRHFKPMTVSGKDPTFIFLSISSCTSPKYYSRSGRVMVHYNVKRNVYKCKCTDSDCMHVFVAKIYLEHNDLLNSDE